MSDEERKDQPETEESQETDLLAQVRELLDSEFGNRFSGLQSTFDRRLAQLADTVDQLKTANLSPEEQEQLQSLETEKLRRENALLKLGKQYPEEVDFLQNFFEAKSLEDQVAALGSFRKIKAAETQAEEPEEPAKPTPVSPNSTRRKTELSLADVQGEMTPELADQILAAADEPGMLVKVRKMLGGN